MDFKNAAQQLIDLLKQEGEDVGADLKTDATDLQAYIATRLANLAVAVGQPGYSDALTAERDAVALKVAGRAIDEADATDARILGVITGAMHIAVVALGA